VAIEFVAIDLARVNVYCHKLWTLNLWTIATILWTTGVSMPIGNHRFYGNKLIAYGKYHGNK